VSGKFSTDISQVFEINTRIIAFLFRHPALTLSVGNGGARTDIPLGGHCVHIMSVIGTLHTLSGTAARQMGTTEALAVADRAALAFGDWSAQSPQARAEVLRVMSEKLDANRAGLIDIAAREIGAAPSWTTFNIDLATDILLRNAELVPYLDDQTSTNSATGVVSTIRRQAAGVALGIAPWNAPITLAVRAVAGPLICGNTAVMKASENCPETHRALIEMLQVPGLPDGALGAVTNAPDESSDVVAALIGHPAIRRVNFTGSTRVGRSVAMECARHLKRCLLELSGKAALIVLDDADINAAIHAAAFGAFFNQGQICMSTERIIVVQDIADAFVSGLADMARTLTAADPTGHSATLGRLINSDAGQRLSALIEDAVAHGADLLLGGQVEDSVMQPVVLDHVAPNMRLYHEESFGPVASVLRVADEEEAISVANDSEYGLSAAIFSRDGERASRLADQIETGIVQINGPTVHDDPAMPFGGMKASGYGRFGGPATVEEFTELRWIARHPPGRVPAL